MFKKTFAVLWLIPLLAFTSIGVMAQMRNTNQSAANQNAQTRELYALFDSEWERSLRENPTFASYLGDRRFNDRLTDTSLAAIERRYKHRVETLEKLKRIDREQLSPADWLNYDLFQKDYEESIEAHKYRQFLLPINQLGGVQTADELAQFLRFQTVKDYEDWVSRLNAYPNYIDQTMELMRAGAQSKILWSRAVLERVPAQIDKQIVENPEQSPFYVPFNNFAKDIPASEQERLRNAARQAVSTKIVPAYRKFREYFVKEYLPASFPAAGIWQQTGGAETYAFLARSYTTTNMTPEQIHEKGLSEVARIRAEMEKIKTQVGFKGALQEFFQSLRTDSQFYYKTPEELLAAYRAMTRRIDPELVKVFKTLPRAPYGVVPIPQKIAPDTTTAYYNSPAADGSRPGLYFVNLYKPETRPKYEMMALSLHEAVPGHHLQIALAQEELGAAP